MNPARQVVLLAGATGRIGSAFAHHVLASGGCIAAAVRRPWQVDKLHETLGRERLLAGLVPTGDGEAAAGFVKGAQDALGPITSFVGAAGQWQPRSAGREPGGDLAELLAANLLANAALARAVLPFLRRRRRGTLLFLGATPAALAAGSAAFAASKAALHEFVAALARDLEGSGVHAQSFLLDDASVGAPERVAIGLASLAQRPLPAGGGLFPLAP